MQRNKPRDSSKNALLDVVVTFAARFDLLKTCLDAVYREAESVPLNVYIIDNGSSAEERIANQSLFEEREDSAIVRFESKRLQQNVGFPAAANEGARMGKAPLIMFLSDDVELNEGTVGKVVKRLDDPQIGIVGIKLMFPKNSTAQGRPAGKVQHIGMCLNIRGEPQHPLVGWSPDNPKTCISREVWAVTGACLTVRRSLFEKVGMFDMVYGLGCLTGDTAIFTEDGIKYLRDFVGLETHSIDKKVASDIEGTNSNIAYYNGEADTLTITLHGGYSIQGTLNHKVVVMGKDGIPAWKELRELTKDDYVAVKYGTYLWGKENIPPDWAYLAGLYIAEGCFDARRVTITNADEPIIDFLLGMGFRKAGKYHYRYNSRGLGEKLQEFGINKHQKAHEKVLSDYLLSLDKESTIELLRGMFDGDGCSQKDGTVTYSSASYGLIRQVQLMLLNFGIVSMIYDKVQVGARISYTLEILADAYKFYDEIGFRLDRKRQNQENISVKHGKTIPYQKQYLKKLREYKHFKYGSPDRMYLDSPDSNIHEVRASKFLYDNRDLYETEEYKHLIHIIELKCAWLRPKSIENGGVEHTFDVHIPDVNRYVANGIVVHNTFEDLSLCMAVRQMGSKVFIDTDATGYHYVGATAEKRQESFPLTYNLNMFRTKWTPSGLIAYGMDKEGDTLGELDFW
jgi:GT2 family glycosyltransferase/intein/homing endonuclease